MSKEEGWEKHCFKKFAIHGRHSGECVYSQCYKECYQHYLDTTKPGERKK